MTTTVTRGTLDSRRLATAGQAPWAVPPVPETVLVADDDDDMRRLLETIVRSEGYAVLSAEDGQRALDLACQWHPDLILLDCRMPRLNGFAVCERLRSDPGFADVPIIFLTGLASTNDKARGFASGGADYVTKPVDRIELAARIRTHLELGRVRRQLRRQATLLEGVVESQMGRLDQARDGQASILVDPRSFPDVDAAVRFQPAHEAGGDFYEIARLSDDQLGLLVADVSGHDLGVAYLTGALKALTGCFTSEALTVEETMLMLNAGLRKFLPAGRYTTACYAKYCTATSTVDLACAGHPAPLFQQRDGDRRYIDLRGDILGIHETVICESVSLPVRRGDRLFLYTDGLIESYPDACGRCGSRSFGFARFSETVGSKARTPLDRTVSTVVDELLEERGGSVADDVVLLGIEF